MADGHRLEITPILWLTNSTVLPSRRDTSSIFPKTFLLKFRIADRQHLIDDQNFRLEMRRHSEREPHIHADE